MVHIVVEYTITWDKFNRTIPANFRVLYFQLDDVSHDYDFQDSIFEQTKQNKQTCVFCSAGFDWSRWSTHSMLMAD